MAYNLYDVHCFFGWLLGESLMLYFELTTDIFLDALAYGLWSIRLPLEVRMSPVCQLITSKLD